MATASGRRILFAGVAADIRKRILSGKLRPGDRIGTYDSLRNSHRVSLGTVASAVKSLQADGLVTTIPGKGIYVADVLPDTERNNDDRILALEERVAHLEAEVMQIRSQLGQPYNYPGTADATETG